MVYRNDSYTEDQWVKALAEGSEDALTALYEELYPALCWYSTRITGDRAAAEDIVQEAFLKIWEKRSIFSTWSGIRSYLYTTVRRDSGHWLHGYERTVSKESTSSIENGPSPTCLDDIIRAEVYRQLQNSVHTLPNQCKMVVTMIFMEGKTTREVADSLKVSQATVKVQKGRGLKLLRLRLPGIFLWCVISFSAFAGF